ncbi:hypothetical protein FH972_024828 [Carpinus fangiana]|uniref:Uncharacterized protein n=1 Tax=Carpinus fangiana TaxID=176857 RepID=A0A5N6KZI3_9ROSI|nr:hypothetical protein FH972_024828 [Carpinus fangiana]
MGKFKEHPQKSKAEKGKWKIDEIQPRILIMARPRDSPRVIYKSKGVTSLKKMKLGDQAQPEAMRPDSEVMGVFPKESSRVEKLEAASKVETYAVAAALKKVKVNVLTSSRKFMGTNSTIPEVLDGRPTREAIVTPDDFEPLAVMPLSSASSSSVPSEIVHLSDSDGDNSLNINQILKDVAFKRMVGELLLVLVP